MNGKAENLHILAENGFRVPVGYVLDAEHYRDAVAPIAGALKRSLPDAAGMRSLIEGLELPRRTLEFIERSLAHMPLAASFAVRSSGTVVSAGRKVGEDGREVSLAGQFDSFLAVPRHEVPSAVKNCWASLFNDRSVQRFQADEAYVAFSSMAVVIQEFVPAKSAIVMMTADPQGTGGTGAIECTWGACEALVSGAVNPDEVVFDRQTGAVISCRIGAKEHRIQHALSAEAGNDDRTPTGAAERNVLSLDLATVRALIDLGARVEALFGCPQDIEAVTDLMGELVITQARPVTVLPSQVTPFPSPNSMRKSA